MSKKIQTFELAKNRVFVAGLFWQPLSSMASSARKVELEKIAKEQQFDLMVVRTGGTAQVGFAAVADGAVAGMCSVAAMISKSLEVAGGDKTLLMATQIDNVRWLFFAQKDGVILPEGDVIGSEDTVRGLMYEAQSIGEWSTIYAPAHWSFHGSQERALKDFFPVKGDKIQFKRWWGLQPVKKGLFDLKRQWPILLAVLVFAGGAVGYSQWKKYKAEKEMAEFVAQQAAASAGANAVKREHPWKQIALAPRFIAECNGAMAKVPSLFPGNWSFTDAACGGGVLKVTWARQPTGWIEHVKHAVPGAVISPDGNGAVLTVPVGTGKAEDEAVPKGDDRTSQMFNVAQKLGLKMTVVMAPLPPPPPPGQPPSVADWRELAWTVTGTTLPPEAVVSYLDAKGFRINKITTSFVGGVMLWSLEGVQYVQM